MRWTTLYELKLNWIERWTENNAIEIQVWHISKQEKMKINLKEKKKNKDKNKKREEQFKQHNNMLWS